MKYDGRTFLPIAITLMVISAGLHGTAATAASPHAAALAHQPAVARHFTSLSAEQLTKRDAFAKRMGKSATALLGPWRVINYHSGKCLTIRNISPSNDAQAVQWTCDYSAPYNEEWYLEDVYGTGRFWHFINAYSDKCLTIRDISTADNAEAVQWTCDYNVPFNEEWMLEDIYGSGFYGHIINYHSNKCLTVRNISTADNAEAVQWTCDYNAPYNELWFFQA